MMNNDERWLNVVYGALGFLASTWIGGFLLSIAGDDAFPSVPILLTMMVGMGAGVLYSLFHAFDILDNPRKRQ